MPKKRLWILQVLLIGLMVFIAGCGKEQLKPPPASEPQAIDYPNDNGEKVIIRWDHYLVSSASKYRIMRGTSKDNIDSLVAEITTQESPSVTDTSSVNNFSDANFYLVLDESSNPPTVTVVEATAENEDSIRQIGKKIQRVEVGFVESKDSEPEPIIVKGSIYNIAPKSGIIDEPVYHTIENATFSESGDSIIDNNEALTLKMRINDRERKFLEQGRRLKALNGADNDLIKKYGKSVFAIITDENKYSLAKSEMKVIDGDAPDIVKPGAKLYYRIDAINDAEDITSGEVISVTTVDDAPLPVERFSVREDTLQNVLLFTWRIDDDYVDFLDRIEIYKTSIEDTLCEAGELIATLNSSWEEYKIDSYESDENEAFYIKTCEDIASANTKLASARPAELKTVSTPDNLILRDHANDEALALDMLWGEPQLALSYRVFDKKQKKTEIDLTNKLYLVNSEVVTIEEDSLVPETANLILSYTDLESSDTKDLAVMYDMNANIDDKAGFAEITIEGMGFTKTIKDVEGVGRLYFEDLKSGEYKITAQMYNKNGRKYDNEATKVELTAVLDCEKFIPPFDPEYYYKIFRVIHTEESSIQDFVHLTSRGNGSHQFIDRWSKDEAGKYREETTYEYSYFLRTVSYDGNYIDSKILGPIVPENNWFNTNFVIIVLFLIMLFAVTGYYFIHAKKGTKFYIRPIAGIVHIDEALGRATEMGKPIMYITGISGIGALPTLASITILERVAKKAAEYQNRLIVPAYDPIVMLVAQETVRSAYLDAGRPDAYNEKDIFFVSNSQFSYAAAVSGMMMREKSATNFFLGWFAAESLILSETGAATGAIQIAGTDAISQLPFFITSCDYTLIGEELYAASAYMSQDPQQLASLKIQDFIKAVNMVLIILGTIAASSGMLWFVNIFKVNMEK